MKIIQIIIILLTTLYLFSCTNPYEGEGDWQEDWIATINSTGDSLNYIIKERAENVQFTPDNTKIIVNREEKGIWSMNLDGTDYKNITDSLLVHSPLPSICTDSLGFIKITFAAYSTEKSLSDIYIMNIDGNNLINLTDSPEIYEIYPHFSSDGSQIVYTTISDSIYTISIMDEKGDNKYDIISNINISRYYYPVISINEERVYYKFSGENYGLYSVRTNGENNYCIFNGHLDYNFISMSMDGTIIVFSANDHIFVVNEEGTEITDLGEGGCAMISNDGTKIVFGGIRIMNSDGTERKELAFGGNPFFSSNGTKIVFIAIREFPEDK